MALLWRCWRTIKPSSIFQFFAIPCAHAFLHFFSFTDYLHRLATTNFFALLLTVVSQNPLPAQVSSINDSFVWFRIFRFYLNRVTFFYWCRWGMLRVRPRHLLSSICHHHFLKDVFGNDTRWHLKFGCRDQFISAGINGRRTISRSW